MPTLAELDTLFALEVNPLLAEHGGGAAVVELDGDTLVIEMVGSCRECLSINETVTGVIKAIVTKKYPEIKNIKLAQLDPDVAYDLAVRMLNHEFD
jgi:Fe-S cluster biogenesis protein NfuA